MDMASRTRSVAVRLGLGACAALALAPLSAEASALETYYERALISVADARCRLFEPGISAALAELDPREAIEIEFSFADGSRRTALLEVGDFAAGRAFLLAAQR